MNKWARKSAAHAAASALGSWTSLWYKLGRQQTLQDFGSISFPMLYLPLVLSGPLPLRTITWNSGHNLLLWKGSTHQGLVCHQLLSQRLCKQTQLDNSAIFNCSSLSCVAVAILVLSKCHYPFIWWGQKNLEMQNLLTTSCYQWNHQIKEDCLITWSAML